MVICEELLGLLALESIGLAQTDHMAAILRQEVEEHAVLDVLAFLQVARCEPTLWLPQHVAKVQREDGELLGRGIRSCRFWLLVDLSRKCLDSFSHWCGGVLPSDVLQIVLVVLLSLAAGAAIATLELARLDLEVIVGHDLQVVNKGPRLSWRIVADHRILG